jgi:hypothetical protein
MTTSNQPLGDKTVLVECDDDFFLVELVYIDGFEVPARCFSEAQLAEWQKDIRAEYESDAMGQRTASLGLPRWLVHHHCQSAITPLWACLAWLKGFDDQSQWRAA